MNNYKVAFRLAKIREDIVTAYVGHGVLFRVALHGTVNLEQS